jgi:hypothetical protein
LCHHVVVVEISMELDFLFGSLLSCTLHKIRSISTHRSTKHHKFIEIPCTVVEKTRSIICHGALMFYSGLLVFPLSSLR